MLFKIETVINRDSLTVWDFLTNLERLPWQTHPIVKEYIKLTQGSFRVGTMYREIIIFRKWKFDILTEVTNYNKPSEIEYSWTGNRMKGDLKYYLKDIVDGTLIMQTQTVFLSGFLKLLYPLLYITFRRRILERLQTIKYVLDHKMEEIKSFNDLFPEREKKSLYSE